MRLVLDTNTALSGLLWGGLPGRLIDAAEGHVLAAALAARADAIVSGDAHLLNLKAFHGMDIITAAAALGRIGPGA